jgi:hypothetical protein
MDIQQTLGLRAKNRTSHPTATLDGDVQQGGPSAREQPTGQQTIEMPQFMAKQICGAPTEFV